MTNCFMLLSNEAEEHSFKRIKVKIIPYAYVTAGKLDRTRQYDNYSQNFQGKFVKNVILTTNSRIQAKKPDVIPKILTFEPRSLA